jgi:nicotinamidase-related amidase
MKSAAMGLCGQAAETDGGEMIRKILYWTTLTMLLLALSVVALVFWGMRPTSGKQIEKYADPRPALLIIDIQEDYTGPKAKKPYREGDRIVAVSNALLAQAQARGAVVVYIQNVIHSPIMSALTGGVNLPGTPGTEMDRRLLKVPTAMTFEKNRSDAFSNPEFDAYLRAQHVDRVWLTGLDGAYCVDATARGALNRGYKVTLFRDGIATESYKKIEDLVKSWREAGAEVKTGSQL